MGGGSGSLGQFDSYLIPTIHVATGALFYPHFMNQETEAQRREVSCQR